MLKATFDTYDTRNSFEALSANFGNFMSISQVDSLSYSEREDYDLIHLAFAGIYVKCSFPSLMSCTRSLVYELDSAIHKVKPFGLIFRLAEFFP